MSALSSQDEQTIASIWPKRMVVCAYLDEGGRTVVVVDPSLYQTHGAVILADLRKRLDGIETAKRRAEAHRQ